MVLLEIIPKDLKDALSSEVRQGSFSGIIAVYKQINQYFKNKPSIILRTIALLENHRQSFNGETLNYFIDRCLENHRCFFQLENQPTDVDKFNDLVKQIFSF